MLIDDQDKLGGEILMCEFKPVKKRAGDVASYTVFVKSKAQSGHVREMIPAGLSFRHIFRVVRKDCKKLCGAATFGTVSPGEASCISRI